MFANNLSIAGYDDELQAAIDNERRRQEEHIELIASENYASPRVMEAQGSVLTNKYAEGYPGKRYYGGCEYVDVAERLALERVKTLFGADYANVQPHSGSQANAAVYMALCQPGDTVLGMSLAHGGHLTHGAKPNFSGKIYNAVQYGLDPATGEIDYDQVEALAREHRPKMIVAGFSAYSRVVDWQRFRNIADEVGAFLLVDMAHVIEKKLNSLVFPGTQGGPLMHVIAAKAVAFLEAMGDDFKAYQGQVVVNAQAMAEVFMARGYDVVSGGTDNHLFLVSFIEAGLTGKDVDAWLGSANITVNMNAVPNDPQSPFITSGIRVGTPAITTRGFGADDARELTGWMCDVIDSRGDEAVIAAVRDKALAICARYPVYA
jgi:glycine hydroxymethyltransferase